MKQLVEGALEAIEVLLFDFLFLGFLPRDSDGVLGEVHLDVLLLDAGHVVALGGRQSGQALHQTPQRLARELEPLHAG